MNRLVWNACLRTDDEPWDVVSAVTRRSSGVAPRACVRVYACVLVCAGAAESLHTYMKKEVGILVYF